MTGLLIVGAIVLFVLWAIYAGWSAPLMKENEDGSWTTIRPERKFSELFGKKSTLKDLPDFQHTPPTPSPTDELASLLIDNERMMHIAGIKAASPEKIAEWQSDKRLMAETKSEALMEDLLAKINPNDMQVKAGIKAYDRTKGGDEIYEADFNIKTGKKGANEIVDAMINAAKSNTLANTEALNEIREKQIRKEIEYKKKMDFEALPFSRLTQDARDQITKIVREDISKQLEDVSHISKAVADFNDQRLGMEVTKPKRKYTKKKK
jgi:hypothetical protein